MDNTKKYDETNRGVLFNISSTDGEPDWKLIQQGKININGDQLRVIGIKRLNQKGEEIVELYRAMGTLKKADQVNVINIYLLDLGTSQIILVMKPNKKTQT